MTRIFDKLAFNNVYELLKLIHSNEIYSSAITTYRTYNSHINKTESFISELNLIFDAGNRIKLTDRLIESEGNLIGKDDIKSFLIEKLLSSDNPYSESVAKYIELFICENGKYVYTPDNSTRLKQGGIRNFLYELDVVELNKNNKTYLLNIDKTLTSTEHVNTSTLSPRIFAILQKIKKEIGDKAELCVMDYERERLKNNNELLNMLKHVALTDVSAGYDILSWEVPPDSEENIPRYIEVKAVPVENNNRFYWSSNEIELARKLEGQYCLYLVPRIKEKFLIDDVRIIRNPSVEIFECNEWDHKIENYSIWAETVN